MPTQVNPFREKIPPFVIRNSPDRLMMPLMTNERDYHALVMRMEGILGGTAYKKGCIRDTRAAPFAHCSTETERKAVQA